MAKSLPYSCLSYRKKSQQRFSVPKFLESGFEFQKDFRFEISLCELSANFVVFRTSNWCFENLISERRLPKSLRSKNVFSFPLSRNSRQNFRGGLRFFCEGDLEFKRCVSFQLRSDLAITRAWRDWEIWLNLKLSLFLEDWSCIENLV